VLKGDINLPTNQPMQIVTIIISLMYLLSCCVEPDEISRNPCDMLKPGFFMADHLPDGYTYGLKQ